MAERGVESDVWDAVQLARHEARPYTLDYTERLLEDFTELHGDRSCGEDPAIVAGLGRFRGRTVAVVGHQKGRDIKERAFRNFGMARPEGYNKAIRVFALADRLGFPVLTFVDTPGAHPGASAERRGQAGAIARTMLQMMRLRVPSVAVVIGEGGSGGALAIAVADRVLMLEHSIYSVISPEACAAILWRDGAQARKAAAAFKPTAQFCHELGVVDAIVPEPSGGAHRDADRAARLLGDALATELAIAEATPLHERRALRRAKFRQMGVWLEPTADDPTPSIEPLDEVIAAANGEPAPAPQPSTQIAAPSTP
jgi:acetyl-CoA carboxylase carboxyl transferase subunit alpha